MPTLDKPMLVEKMNKFVRQVRKNGNKIGTCPMSMAIDYNNVCNLKCDFCYEQNETKYNKEHLTMQEIERIADEAHDLGIWEIVLQGGELLINVDNCIEIVKACKPERFRMILITNGFFLTEEIALRLKENGVDCVGVSVSDLNKETHDASRGVEGAHARALDALDNCKKVGLTVWAQVIFGHHNSHSTELREFLEYLKYKDIGTYFLLAMPYGTYKDKYLDAEDMRIFSELRKKYTCSFDTWDMFDSRKERITGCWSMNRCFVTPLGDVLPCPFINIKLGNVREKSLKEIYEDSFKIKYFSQYSPVCIAGQNREFRKKFLDGRSESMFEPIIATDVFTKEDYI